MVHNNSLTRQSSLSRLDHVGYGTSLMIGKSLYNNESNFSHFMKKKVKTNNVLDKKINFGKFGPRQTTMWVLFHKKATIKNILLWGNKL